MEIYVVNGCRFTRDEWQGVFSTPEKAISYIRTRQAKNDWPYGENPEDFILATNLDDPA